MTFHSDLTSASDGIQRATALNDKLEAERLRIMDAISKAVVVVGVLVVFGIAVMAGAERSHRIALDQQENIAWKR